MLDRTKLPLERTEPCQIPIPLLTTYAGNAIRTYFNRVLWVQPQDATVVCQQEVGAGGVRVLRVYECGAVPKDCALVLPTHYIAPIPALPLDTIYIATKSPFLDLSSCVFERKKGARRYCKIRIAICEVGS